jgi:hypothetical protein
LVEENTEQAIIRKSITRYLDRANRAHFIFFKKSPSCVGNYITDCFESRKILYLNLKSHKEKLSAFLYKELIEYFKREIEADDQHELEAVLKRNPYLAIQRILSVGTRKNKDIIIIFDEYETIEDVDFMDTVRCVMQDYGSFLFFTASHPRNISNEWCDRLAGVGAINLNP